METPSREQAYLHKRLILAELPVSVDQYGTLFITHEQLRIFIDQRPANCDRGRWLVNVERFSPEALTIDNADMFPRYYFHAESVVSEISTWWRVRMAQIERKAARA